MDREPLCFSTTEWGDIRSTAAQGTTPERVSLPLIGRNSGTETRRAAAAPYHPDWNIESRQPLLGRPRLFGDAPTVRGAAEEVVGMADSVGEGKWARAA